MTDVCLWGDCRMGTAVHCKTYSRAFHSMRDLNEDANNGNWPLYCGDSTLKNGPCYTSQSPSTTADGYLKYDKEVMRQTMLKQDAIFRDQVYQLHRIYRIQNDLTHELKRKELSNHHKPEESLESSPLSSQMPFQDTQNMWRISGLPLMGTTTCTRPSTSEADHMQGGSLPNHYGDCLRDRKILESKSVKVPNKLFGLELPTRESLNNKEKEQNEQRKNIQAPLVAGCSEGGIKLSLSSGIDPSWRCDTTKVQNKRRFADLNEPIQVDEETASDPVVKPYPEFQRLTSDFFQNSQKGKNNGTHLNVRPPLEEEDKSRREWFSYRFEAGQSKSNLDFSPKSFYPEKFLKPSEPMQAESCKKAQNLPPFLLFPHSKRGQWRERTCGNEISEACDSHSNNYFSEAAVGLHRHSSYPSVPQSDIISGSSPVSSWMKQMSSLTQNPVAVQALPCFKTSVPSSKTSKLLFQSNEFIGDTRHMSSNSGSNSSFGSEGTYINGVFHGTHFEPPNASQVCFPSASEHVEGANCMDGRSSKGNELNLAFRSRFQDGSSQQKDLMIIDGEGKNKDGLRGLPWLKANSASSNGLVKGRAGLNELGLNSSPGHPRHSTSKVDNGNIHSSRFIQDISSASCSYMTESQRTETVDCRSSTKILGFSIYDSPLISKELSTLTSASKSLKYSSKAEEIQNKGSINHINLNSCTTEEDATSAVKILIEIDLEAPVVSETLENIPLAVKSVGNQLEIPVQSHTELYPLEDCFRIAAEAIVMMSSTSSSAPNYIENATCYPSEEYPRNSLHLLAEVVSLNTDTEVCGDHQETCDEFDYFEFMTLNLTDTTEKEYSCGWVPENPEVEETGTGSGLLLARRRRGQARRGRQKRDFQRDILPGLVTLSRHEVTEDIQAFEELMRVTGHPWETRFGRRNGARSGRGRGRRRLTSPVPEIVQQPNNGDLVLEDKSLKGWGKTTRRPRRQRLPASTPLSSPTQA
ncbi:hypothetical protein GIB67_007271 [Kingdonia uniflora]|uniref:Uncharacterized protein n=1 Tax=Kingdonia uniflora TaxID=39325 RepID=A0A7J7NXF5_9MAGN|nr:hypothetical protein GIB67_007271 [Kingdonia uniflora]